jgi:predicted lipid-binding transport protein (Tim44 family)
MSGRHVNPELIILAVVAVFVISRLYAVLGQRTGIEPRPRRARESSRPSPAPLQDDGPEAPESDRPAARAAFTGPAAAGLEAIAAIDASFVPDEFTQGARRAYEAIVAAFADGDRGALRPLLDTDVFEAWTAAISEREQTGQEPLRLLRLRAARIVDASLDAEEVARVAVSFEGDLSDGETMRKAREIWTFKRPVRSPDPNWVLDEVVAAS